MTLSERDIEEKLKMLTVRPKVIKVHMDSVEGKMKKVEHHGQANVHGRGKKLPERVIEEKLKKLTIRPKVIKVYGCTCMCMFMYVYSIEDLFNEDADAREEDMIH